MALRPKSEIRSRPFRGGSHTAIEVALIPNGGYSLVQNFRAVKGDQGGFKTRPGYTPLHTVADGSNEGVSIYQFKKNRATEIHTFAQMGDGDVLEASSEPPSTTAGAFGPEVFSGSSGQIPASWSNIGDNMLYSNGVDQHQIYGGTSSFVEKFIVYKGSQSGEPELIPVKGEDYSDEVTNGVSTDVAVLDSLSTLAAFDCLFFRTPVPAKSITITVSAPNGNTAAMTLNYWKDDNTWTAASGQADGTSSGGKTIAQTGTLSWTAPTDLIPKYLYGTSGFWYQIELDSALDAEVEISSVTYAADWQSISNVWNGITANAVEVQVEGTTTFAAYGSGSVSLTSLPSSKKIVISSADPIEGIYVDVGSTPNATGTTIEDVKYWDGAAFVSTGTVGTHIFDFTKGLSNTGWIVFPRKIARPRQFNASRYYAFWYELTFDTQIAANVTIAVQTQPYFNIGELGNGRTNATWKDRACYSFDRFGEFLYISGTNKPLVLNGLDFGILKAGDGRSNKIVAQRRFHNELMVWQEEKGLEGGSLTLFEGFSPTTFGKLVLSSTIGTFSDKTVAVVDGVLTSTATDEQIKTLVFFLSWQGVVASDGRTLTIISDDIQNYFDPNETESIRRGYADKMWLKHDRSDNVLRLGIVSGNSATLPNIFPVFDLNDKVWYFDELGKEMSCMAEIEADSGDNQIIQIGAGVDNGTIYHLNNGTNDDGIAIDAFTNMEIDGGGQMINIREMILRIKGGEGGVTIIPFINDVAQESKVIA